MKVGLRKRSYKKSWSAYTSGRWNRAWKRAVNPFYGKKGMGFIKNPKRAMRNAIYHRTTFGLTEASITAAVRKNPKKTAQAQTKSQIQPQSEQNIIYDKMDYENKITRGTISKSGHYSELRKKIKIALIFNYLLMGLTVFLAFLSLAFVFLWIPTIFSAVLWILVRNNVTIDLHYDKDEKEYQDSVAINIAPLNLLCSESNKIYRVSSVNKILTKNASKNYLSEHSDLDSISVKKKLKFPFKCDSDDFLLFSSGNGKLLFLPDGLVAINGIDVGILNYNDVVIKVGLENLTVNNYEIPSDAVIIEKGINSSTCKYLSILIVSEYGLNTKLLFSNAKLINKLSEVANSQNSNAEQKSKNDNKSSKSKTSAAKSNQPTIEADRKKYNVVIPVVAVLLILSLFVTASLSSHRGDRYDNGGQLGSYFDEDTDNYIADNDNDDDYDTIEDGDSLSVEDEDNDYGYVDTGNGSTIDEDDNSDSKEEQNKDDNNRLNSSGGEYQGFTQSKFDKQCVDKIKESNQKAEIIKGNIYSSEDVTLPNATYKHLEVINYYNSTTSDEARWQCRAFVKQDGTESVVILDF